MADLGDMAVNLITLLRAAHKVSRAIYGAVDSIRAAPVHIKAVSSDTKAMFSVLGTLSGYLNDEENAVGVLHRVVAADLVEVLTNSISVLKELQLIVGQFIKEDRGERKLGKWTSIRLNFKETEVKQWREQLVAHKITLSVAISMANLVNTRSMELTTIRVEKEVLELKSMITGLLIRINATEELQADRDIIIDNYKSTIRRVVRGADSIISETTWERPTSDPSPSIGVSSIGVSEKTEGSYKTARSIVTAKPSIRIDDANVHNTTDFRNSPSLPDKETSRPYNYIKRSNENDWRALSTNGLKQLFVKGASEGTEVFSFEGMPSVGWIHEEIQIRTGIPPHVLSLRVDGRVLTGMDEEALDIENFTTIHANVKATGIGQSVDMWDNAFLGELSDRYRPWYTRYLPMIRRSSSSYLERHSFYSSSMNSAAWHDENELKTQQLSFAFLAQGLRRIVARGGSIRSGAQSLDSE